LAFSARLLNTRLKLPVDLGNESFLSMRQLKRDPLESCTTHTMTANSVRCTRPSLAFLGASLLAAAPLVSQTTDSHRVPCDTVLASMRVVRAAQYQLELRHDPRSRPQLPWTDTLPPRIITDANTCRAAARAYLHDSLRTRPDSTLAAGVVLAGGLYFVQAWPLARGGEWVLTAVLDRNLHWVIGLAN
jgi:hypothetical protein